MRTLYYVPIIHTYEELGTVGAFLKEVEQQLSGPQNVALQRTEIQNYWSLVAARLAQTPLRYDKLYIYMDSLPTKEEAKNRIYEDHIQRQFPVYLIINDLVAKGAEILGTESLELLQAECNYWQKLAQRIEKQNWLLAIESKKKAEEFLKKRDVFIAQRINETLPDGYQAILFIGRAHKVIEELDRLEETDQLIYPLRVIYL